MLIQSGEGEGAPSDPSQWLYSVTKREPRHCDFLVRSGAATFSVSTKSLADSLGGKPSGPEVERRSATGHQFTTTGNTTVCLRTRDGINVAETFRVRPRTLDCRGLSHQLAKCATMATSSHPAALVELYSTSSLMIESNLNDLVVCIGGERTRRQSVDGL